MSERHSFHGYDFEVRGHDLVVRDDRGAVVDTVALAAIEGEFQLPNGQQVDLASLLLSRELDPADFETAAGGAESAGGPESGPIAFRTFEGDNGFNRGEAAGTLENTSLSYSVIDSDQEPAHQRAFAETAIFAGSTIPVNWAPHHDQWRIPENQDGGDFGRLVDGDPAGFTFVVSDDRFDIVDGVLQLKDGFSFDFESESFIDIQITATSKTGESQTQSVRIDVIDENEGQTGIDLDNALVAENAAGAVIGRLTVSDPDAGDSQSFQLSDNRFEIVNGQLKLKDGIALDFETEPSVNVTVTATDKGGHGISQQFTIVVGDVNEAQTALSLDHNTVSENAAGAVIGGLTVADPDAGDSQSFVVSDSRFEIVEGQLKLKDGLSLDFEIEQTIDMTVTATDKAGHSISQDFSIVVGDVNEAQTALSLNGAYVAENAAGAVIGDLTVTDPDQGDSQTFIVSDSRFEIVNGQLKLKDGIALDFEVEPTVNIIVTATDKGGHSIAEQFTLGVGNINEAPVVTVKDGSLENHIVNTSTAYNPVASATVGNYLYSNDSAGVKVPSASLLNGVDAANMTLAAPTEVSVTFQKEAAGNRNMVGTYQYDDNGNIIAGSVKFVWLDASAGTEGKLGSGMVKDFLGYAQSNTVSLGTMPAGTHVGFFTISNGASDGANRTLLGTAAAGTASQTAAMAAIASQLSIKVDANGNGHVFVGSSQMNGDVFFTHNKSLNTDFNGTSDIDHMTSGTNANLSGQLLIGVEDLNGGGDRDYNDVVFSVNLGTYNVNKTTQSFVQPNVDFSDVDSNSLSEAVIHSTGFQAGDALNIPPSGLFNVNVAHTTNDYTITITGKTGTETVDQYESFVNAITFSTSSKAEGARGIDYNVVDEGGLTSNVGHATLSVTNSYEISVSQLGAGQNTLGAGDDHLYLNGTLSGQLNLGNGHDTVHLAKQDQSFGHGDAAKLSNVEAIDATGYGMNKVALSINDVLDMTDGGNHLTVLGDKGDTVTLSGDGSGHHWSVASTGNEFTTYVWSDPLHQAVVEISNQLTATLSA